MITVDDLQAYVGASISDAAFLATCLSTASNLVNAYIGNTQIPEAVLDTAYLQVSSEMYHRRNAPSGISQFAAPDGSPMRVARDPLSSTYPLLNRYVLGGV